MGYKLFLDDTRHPRSTYPYREWGDEFFKDVVIARSCDEAISILQKSGRPYVLMLDYNLGSVKNGMDFVRSFIEFTGHPSRLPRDFEYFTHTNSPIGAAEMERALEEFLMMK